MIEGERAGFGHREAPAGEDEIARRIVAESQAQTVQDEVEARDWGRRTWLRSLTDGEQTQAWLKRFALGAVGLVGAVA